MRIRREGAARAQPPSARISPTSTPRGPFGPFWRNYLTPLQSRETTDAVTAAAADIARGARGLERSVDRGPVTTVLTRAVREAEERLRMSDRDLRRRWLADVRADRQARSLSPEGLPRPKLPPLKELREMYSPQRLREAEHETQSYEEEHRRTKHVQTDRGPVQQFGMPDQEAKQNRRAVGLAGTAIPIGRGGSLLARGLRYAARKPVKATLIGTGVAHATGHLSLPKPPKPGQEHAGLGLPGSPRWAERAGRALVDVGLYSGPAVYEAGKAVVLDARAARRGDTSFKRSRELGVDVGKAIKAGVLDPTNPQHFVQNVLLVGGVSNVLAHGVERGIAVRKAPTKRAKAKAALRTPPPGETTLHGPGGINAQRLEPDAPILRYPHRARTKWLNWRLAHPDSPLNRSAVGRAENVLARERGSEERVLTKADANRIAFLRNEERKLSQEEATASRLLYTEGRAPEGDWFAFSRPEEVVARHAKTERAYARRARQRGDRDGEAMHLIEAEAIEASLSTLKAPSAEFRATLAHGRRESRLGEKEDIRRQHLDVAQAETRKAGLAFLHGRGAPARALEGETRDAFLRRAAKIDRKLRVEAERAKRKAKRATRSRPGTVRQTRERTLPEIQARLAVLDHWYERLVDRTAAHFDVDPAAKRLETLYRNRTRNRLKGGIRRGNMPTVNAELRIAAEERIAAAIERQSDHPTVKRTATLVAERERLRSLLNEAGEASMEGRASPALGVATTTKRVARVERPEGIRRHEQRLGQITAERARLAEQAAAAQGLQVPGATFFSTAEHFKLPMRSTNVRGAQTGAGTSIGPPTKGRYRFGSMRRFTGSGIEKTGQVQRPIAAIAELQAGRTIAHAQESLYHELWSAATPRKTTELQVAIRSARTNPLDLRRLERAQKAADAGDETPLGEFIRSRYDDLLVPEAESQLIGVGERIPGVRWIDKALVKRLEPRGDANSGLHKFARAINRPARFFGVYARGGYIATNKPSNEAMGVFLHGPKAFSVGTRGRLKRSLGQRGLAIAEGVAGTTRTESYRMADLMRRRYAHAHPVGKALGQTGETAAWIEDFVVRHVTNTTDRSFRLRVFEIRAAQRGYDTPAKLRRLLTSRDPKVRADLAAVGRRARKDAVDFDSLTPAERNLAEIFYFYPWTSRAFVWTGRSIVNRPLTAGTIAAAAPVARERQPDWLLKAPEWARGYVATKAGLINLGPVSTWATPAQIAQEAKGIGETLLGKRDFGQERSFAREMGTPILQVAGGDPLQNIFGTSGIGNLLGFGRAGKTFPDNSLGARAKRFGAGSLWPRQPDREYLRDKYLEGLPFEERVRERAKALPREKRAQYVRDEMRTHERRDWPPERRARARVFDRRQSFYEETKRVAPKALEKGKLPRSLRMAFTIEAERQAQIAAARDGLEPKTRDYHFARYKVELGLLVRFKQIPRRRAVDVLKLAQDASVENLIDANQAITARYWQSKSKRGPLYLIGYSRRALEKAGAVGLD